MILGYSTYLQHVQEGRFPGIVETQEQELGMFVKQTKGRQDVVNYFKKGIRRSVIRYKPAQRRERGAGSQNKDKWGAFAVEERAEVRPGFDMKEGTQIKGDKKTSCLHQLMIHMLETDQMFVRETCGMQNWMGDCGL